MKNKKYFGKILLVILVIVFWALSAILSHKNSQEIKKEGKMKLTTVFDNNQNIPSKYTCDGEDLAPILTISEVPKEAKSLVLIVDDPDAPMGTWVHWVLYNLPPNTTTIEDKKLPEGVKQGMTDFKRIGWGGPCPPYGVHRYFFKLYAIDKETNFQNGMTKAQVLKSIEGSIIEKYELIGLYSRVNGK